MIKYHHYHQGLSIPRSSRYPIRRHRRDQFFRLPTVMAQNDVFLRRLYSVVSFYLDDHPYPSKPDEFRRRTREIKQNVHDLNLSPEQEQFLRRLMKETGVSLVRISLSFESTFEFYSIISFRSISGKVLISLHSMGVISMISGLNFPQQILEFPHITKKYLFHNMELVFLIINYSSEKQLSMVQHGFKWKRTGLMQRIFTMIPISRFITDKIFSNIASIE